MTDIVTEAKDLVQQAKQRDKCLREARWVERRLEDLGGATGAGNWQIATGFISLAAGLGIGLLTGWTGIGTAAAAGFGVTGVSTIAGGLAAKRDAVAKALKDLERAVEDLRECLAG